MQEQIFKMSLERLDNNASSNHHLNHWTWKVDSI